MYEGKGKKIFSGGAGRVILFFKDDLTAFQGAKKGSFKGKGAVCHKIFCLVFSHLKSHGAPVHWLQSLGERESLCEKAQVFPLEVVVRNRLAGSTAKRLGILEGKALQNPPLLEYYFKSDKLGDPFVSEDQIACIPLMESASLLPEIRKKALEINSILKPYFLKAGLELIDLKMEFGLNSQKKLLLVDDITPDSCRLWDLETQKRLDKDRFRKDLGDVENSYKEIARRLEIAERKNQL